MDTTLHTTAKNLLDIKVSIKELKGKELIEANTLATKYLSELYSNIKDINSEKDKYKFIRDYKINLMDKISDDDKVLNTTLLTLNKALKNANETVINILKLSDFSLVSKYSKLSNSNQKKINNTENLTKDNIIALVSELLKKQNKEANIKGAKKLLANNGYKVA